MEGVEKFTQSFDALLGSITDRASRAERITT
jgi:hypothetical protein